MSDDVERRVSRRSMLKSTLSIDQAATARKERRSEARKKQKLKYLNEIREFPEPQQIKLPRQWQRDIVDTPPEKMSAGMFVAQAMNRIMALMLSTDNTRESKILALINAAVTRTDVAHLLKNEHVIYDMAEPPVDCLKVIHEIIKNCKYVNANAWLFLAALLSGTRVAFDMFYELEETHEKQREYYDQLVLRTCAYIDEVLAPDIALTITARVPNTVDHIRSACFALSYLCDDYQDDVLLKLVAERSVSLSHLVNWLCVFCYNGIIDESMGLFETSMWYDIMDQTLKPVKWFGSMVRQCYEIDSDTRHTIITSDNTIPSHYTAVKNYRLSGASKSAVNSALTLTSRAVVKGNYRTYCITLDMLQNILYDCTQVNDSDVSPEEYFRAVTRLCQSIPYKDDKILRRKFFDFLGVITSVVFSNRHSGSLAYAEMYAAIADVLDETSRAMGVDPILSTELGSVFDDILWNLVVDDIGLGILSEFTKYPNLYKLAAVKISAEFTGKKGMLFDGYAPDLDSHLLCITQIATNSAMIIGPLRHRLKTFPYKRDTTFQEVDNVCKIPTLVMIRDFVTIVTAFWNSILRQSNNPGFLHSITPLPDASFRVPMDQVQLASEATSNLRRVGCKRHLSLLRNILVLYMSLLQDTSLKAVSKYFSMLPNLEVLEKTFVNIMCVIGTPTYNQEISEFITMCLHTLTTLKESYDKVSAILKAPRDKSNGMTSNFM